MPVITPFSAPATGTAGQGAGATDAPDGTAAGAGVGNHGRGAARLRRAHRAQPWRPARPTRSHRQGAGQHPETLRRCAGLAGYPVEQTDARRVR